MFFLCLPFCCLKDSVDCIRETYTSYDKYGEYHDRETEEGDGCSRKHYQVSVCEPYVGRVLANVGEAGVQPFGAFNA